MSGLLKGIGKVFKKLKKIALPVLAIGAIALTGGAALGVLPALSSTIGSLGLGTTLTGALTTAAQGATFGAVGSALMGKNPIKGAVTGMAIGGGMGLASGLLAPAAGAATGSAGSAAGDIVTTGRGAMSAADIGAAVTQGPTAAVAAPAAAAGQAAAAGTGGGIMSGLGGLGGVIKDNPILVGAAMQGIGSGIMARQAAKEDQREYDSTLGYTGLGGNAATMTDAGYLAYDPSKGTIVRKGTA